MVKVVDELVFVADDRQLKVDWQRFRTDPVYRAAVIEMVGTPVAGALRHPATMAVK